MRFMHALDFGLREITARRRAERQEHLAKLAFSLNQLDDKRLKYERQLLDFDHNSSQERPLFEVYIERIFQRQRKIVVEILDEYRLANEHKYYVYLKKFSTKLIRDRLLPKGEGWRFNNVTYYRVPAKFQADPIIKQLSASYPNKIDTKIIGPTLQTSKLAVNSKQNLGLIVSYIESSTSGKIDYPWLWSIDSNLTTYFTSTQVQNFILPELKKLRSATRNLYLKDLVNYFYVLFKKVDGIDLVIISKSN